MEVEETKLNILLAASFVQFNLRLELAAAQDE